MLQVYVAYILAVQAHAEAQGGGRCRLPLAIMVSDDTAEGIQRLLDANDHFGLEPAQVTPLEQEKSNPNVDPNPDTDPDPDPQEKV